MKPIYTKNRVIGLLGGSFNPAHEGHLHITLHALNALKMDAVWWLVSPQNPLKDKTQLVQYEKRLAGAKSVAAKNRRIYVSDIEATLNTRYSVDTIACLQSRYPGTRFIWLMGADNLAQFHRWKNWRTILQKMPVMVFDRAPYSHSAIHSKTYQYARRFLLKNNGLRAIEHLPVMRFLHLKRHPASSSLLRKALGKDAFLRHNRAAG